MLLKKQERPQYSSLQKHIAASLVESPKTAEGLVSALRTPLPDIERELKGLAKLKVASKSKDGKYSISKDVAEGVARRREISSKDTFKLRLRVIIEAQAIEKDLLKGQMKKVEDALRSEPDFTIYDCVLEKTVKEGQHYTSFLEVNLSLRDFPALVRLMFFYGPAAIEVLKPERYEIGMDALQDGLVDMSRMVNSYNHYITKLMNREELAAFHRKIFG